MGTLERDAITALRAALAQQAEPVAGNTLLKEFLAAAKEAGVTHLRLAEPVAYRYKYSDGFWRFSNGKRVNGCDPIESQALYTAPPQQAELVDTDCHTQGICQRSGYGIGKQAEPVQEPVAEARYDGTLRWLEPHGVGLHRIQGPLYTASTPRKPLTKEEMRDLVTNWFAEDWAIEKALGLLSDYDVKRAHGIPKP